MRRSAEVRSALLRFYEVFPAGDLEDFAQIIVRKNEGVVVIGTDPAQWTEGREQWIAAREAVVHAMEGLRFEAGEEPHGYEEGSMGWVADRPRAVLPDGNTISTRLSGVVRREEGEWRLVHIHISVGVPDEEVVELQKRWSSQRLQGPRLQLLRIPLPRTPVNKGGHEAGGRPQKSPLAAGVRPELVANGTLWQYCIPKDARR